MRTQGIQVWGCKTHNYNKCTYYVWIVRKKFKTYWRKVKKTNKHTKNNLRSITFLKITTSTVRTLNMDLTAYYKNSQSLAERYVWRQFSEV